MRAWLVPCLALAACGAPSSPDAGVDAGLPVVDAGPTLNAFQQAMLSEHNAVRIYALPDPMPPLPLMQWSPSAQALAEDWAARCNFTHRSPNSLGENLAGATIELSPGDVVSGWAAEKADYTLSTNTCRAGQACGHYTQIVWRTSIGLGCAQHLCTTGSPFSTVNWYFVVCNYDPAGNLVGQKPY